MTDVFDAEAGLFALLRADGGLELRHASSGDVYVTAEVQTNTGLASKDGHVALLSRNQALASRRVPSPDHQSCGQGIEQMASTYSTHTSTTSPLVDSPCAMRV